MLLAAAPWHSSYAGEDREAIPIRPIPPGRPDGRPSGLRTYEEAARDLFFRLAFAELLPAVLSRAIEPFPVPVRTLDALHLASAHFLKTRDRKLSFATYDDSLGVAAKALNLKVVSP